MVGQWWPWWGRHRCRDVATEGSGAGWGHRRHCDLATEGSSGGC